MIFKIFLSNCIVCYNKQKNSYIIAPKGYSYWFLFFIFSFPSILAFYRKDYKMMMIVILLATATMGLVLISKFLTLFSLIIYYGFLLYLSFVYNFWYLRRMLKLNYKFTDIACSNDKFIISNFSESQIQNFIDDSYILPDNYKAILVKQILRRFTFSLLLFITYILFFLVLRVLVDKFVI